MGSSIIDVTQFWTIFDPPPPHRHVLFLRPLFCRHNIFEPLPPHDRDVIDVQPLSVLLSS